MSYRQILEDELAVEGGALLLRRGLTLWAQSQWMLVLGGRGVQISRSLQVGGRLWNCGATTF